MGFHTIVSSDQTIPNITVFKHKLRIIILQPQKELLKLNASAMTFCHDFLHKPPFGVQKRLPTKWRTKLARRPFGVFLASFWRTKKAAWPFAVLFWVLDAKKSPKGQQKVAQPFLSSNLVSNQKKTAKSHGGHFGRQKVVMVKRTAKSRGTCVHFRLFSLNSR